MPTDPTTPTTEAGRALLVYTEQDLDDISWVVWFARKAKGSVREVARFALEQNPEIRLSAIEAQARADERRRLAGLVEAAENLCRFAGRFSAGDIDLAALRASVTPPPDDLGAAWAEVEATLPDGWGTVTVFHPFDGEWTVRATRQTRFGARGGARYQRVDGRGSTPAAALRALAARLSDTEPAP